MHSRKWSMLCWKVVTFLFQWIDLPAVTTVELPYSFIKRESVTSSSTFKESIANVDALVLQQYINELITVPSYCKGEIFIWYDNQCGELNDNTWSFIHVDESKCNSRTSSISIRNNPCLVYLMVARRSFQNVQSVVIRDNPNLNYIRFQYDSYINGCFKNTQSLTISSSIVTH